MTATKGRLVRWVASLRDDGFISFARDSLIAFLFLCAAGFAAGLLVPDWTARVAAQVQSSAASSGVMDGQGRPAVLALFLHNLETAAVSILFGLLPALHLPALFLGVNALVLGFSGAYYVQNGLSLLAYLAGILPHGLFEIPALCLAFASGLYLCTTMTSAWTGRSKGSVSAAVRQILLVYLLLVVPLTAAAAVVECYLTPLLLRLFL